MVDTFWLFFKKKTSLRHQLRRDRHAAGVKQEGDKCSLVDLGACHLPIVSRDASQGLTSKGQKVILSYFFRIPARGLASTLDRSLGLYLTQELLKVRDMSFWEKMALVNF